MLIVCFVLTIDYDSFQDDENGGIADRPGDMADVFHTFFGVAGILGFAILS